MTTADINFILYIILGLWPLLTLIQFKYIIILDPYPLYVKFSRRDTIFECDFGMIDWQPSDPLVSYAFLFSEDHMADFYFLMILRLMREILQALAWTPCSQCHPNLNGLLTKQLTCHPLRSRGFTYPLPLALYPRRYLSQEPLWFQILPSLPQFPMFPKIQDWPTGLTQLQGSGYHHPSPLTATLRFLQPSAIRNLAPNSTDHSQYQEMVPPKPRFGPVWAISFQCLFLNSQGSLFQRDMGFHSPCPYMDSLF